MEVSNVIEIPIWEKHTLSIEEAASYFRIGENKLRQLIYEIYQKLLEL